jgi:hypothetical protein
MRMIGILLLTSIMWGGAALADSTFVSGGEVSGDWSYVGSPYIIQGEVQVASGDTLAIGHGVTISFSGAYRLEVRGVLMVGGTADSPVLFTTDTLTNPGGWGGIRLLQPSGISRISNCIVESGMAIADGDYGLGGGLMCDVATVVIDETTFRGCEAMTGHAIYARAGSSVTMTNCTILQNGAMTGAGGGICIRNGSTLRMTNCHVVDNTALYGGGVVVDGSTAVIEGCAIDKNSAGVYGGGLYCSASTLTIRNTKIAGNTSIGGGGMDARNDVNVHMDHCEITDNSAMRIGAWGGGGGLLLQSGEQWITNCTFVGNVAGSGGAISGGEYVHLTNCIVAFQTAGEAMYFAYSWPQVRYCCFAGNVGGNFTGQQIPAGLGMIQRTNVNGDSCDQFMNIYSDPLFSDSSSQPLQLGAVSPCVNAGDPATAHDPDGTIADIGAYYYNQMTASDPARVELPLSHALSAYPNPFNPATSITYDVPQTGFITLKIYNLLGREVATLANGRTTAGSYAVQWNASEQPSGTYIAVLTAGTSRAAQKLLLLK